MSSCPSPLRGADSGYDNAVTQGHVSDHSSQATKHQGRLRVDMTIVPRQKHGQHLIVMSNDMLAVAANSSSKHALSRGAKLKNSCRTVQVLQSVFVSAKYLQCSIAIPLGQPRNPGKHHSPDEWASRIASIFSSGLADHTLRLGPYMRISCYQENFNMDTGGRMQIGKSNHQEQKTQQPKGKTRIPRPDLRLTFPRTAKQTAKGKASQIASDPKEEHDPCAQSLLLTGGRPGLRECHWIARV